MSKELIDKLHELFKEGSLEEVLKLLAKEEKPPGDHSALLSKFREANKNFNQKGIITYETFALEISRIRDAVSNILNAIEDTLNLSDAREKQIFSSNDNSIISEIEKTDIALETIGQPGELSPDFQALEQSFTNSPDNEAMNHPSFTDHEGQPRSTAHFKTYKQMLSEIRERMGKRRHNFCMGHLDDANQVFSIVERVGKRLMQTENTLNSDYQRALEKFKKEVLSFKNDISNPDFEQRSKMSAAIVKYVLPFCDEIQRFERKFDKFASDSILDEFPPPTQN